MRWSAWLAVTAIAGSIGCVAEPPPVPTYPEPPPVPLLPHDTFTIASPSLHETRTINLYIPEPCKTAPCGLLYALDGGVKEDFPHLIYAVDNAWKAGKIVPLVVIGIENTERRRDMTGPTEVPSDLKIAKQVGGSAAFRSFIKDELFPAVDARVKGDGKKAIVGESLAGLFVVETFFVAPDMFDTYLAISPSLWWNNHLLVRQEPDWRKTHTQMTQTLYLASAGDDDTGGAVRAMWKRMRIDAPPGMTFVYEPQPGEHHKTIYRATETAVLDRFFAPPGTPPKPLPQSTPALEPVKP